MGARGQPSAAWDTWGGEPVLLRAAGRSFPSCQLGAGQREGRLSRGSRTASSARGASPPLPHAWPWRSFRLTAICPCLGPLGRSGDVWRSPTAGLHVECPRAAPWLRRGRGRGHARAPARGQPRVCFHWESFDLLKEPLLWKPNEKIIEWNVFAFHLFLTLVPARSESCRPAFSSGSCKFDKNTKGPFSSLCQLWLDKLPCVQSGAVTSLSVDTNYVTGPFLMHTDNQMAWRQKPAWAFTSVCLLLWMWIISVDWKSHEKHFP